MPLDAALDALSGMLAAARNKRALIDPGAVAIPRSIEEAIAVQDAVNARVGGQPRG